MRLPLLVAALLLALTGCSAIRFGPDPTPGMGVRIIVTANGDFGGQALADQIPLTALVRGHGNVTITGRAFPPPFVTIDGDWTVIVEPMPGKEAEAIAAVERGDLLIRRNGVRGALNPVGSVAAWKDAVSAPRMPRPQTMLLDGPCPDGKCRVPHP